jgi:OmpA-OmpF porin, OOP family
MTVKSKVLAAAVILGATVSSAMADNFYVALDAGQTTAKDACTGLPAGVTGCKDTATLVRGAGGYQFTPMWGAEVSYADYGKESLGTGFGSSFDWHLTGLEISGTGTFPIASSGFSVIAKLGVAQTNIKLTGGGTSASATSTKFAFGVGGQYDFTKNLSVRAQYEDLGNVGDDTTGKSKVTLLSAGVVFRF